MEQLHQPPHMRHLDLMDLMAMYQPRASAPLDELRSSPDCPASSGWTVLRFGCHSCVAKSNRSAITAKPMRPTPFTVLAVSVDAWPAHEQYEKLDLVRGTLARSNAPHWKNFSRLGREQWTQARLPAPQPVSGSVTRIDSLDHERPGSHQRQSGFRRRRPSRRVGGAADLAAAPQV